MVQWLRDNGCPWDTNTCLAAARHGHLEVLQWARSNGCPWDRRLCLAIARGLSVAPMRFQPPEPPVAPVRLARVASWVAAQPPTVGPEPNYAPTR
jgi:hypothetical protein